ncbi:MAG: UvrD-helicase domain-containing protein [Pseudomonadota bacterium]|nr:UvrD-helicase domain-containing protein [Pseudomonadota bacterium]
MPFANSVIVATAGSGKSTSLIQHAIDNPENRIAIVTYTKANAAELVSKQYELAGTPLPNLTIYTWFSFLLEHCVRPYSRALYPHRISEMVFVQGRSAPRSREANLGAHYFSRAGCIYSDKVSKFSVKLNRHTNLLPMERLAKCFDHVMIDECQDLQGYDLDLIEAFFRTDFNVTLVGDPRQATYSTNNSNRHLAYAGRNIVNKFSEWEEAGLCEIARQTHSYRCNQDICDFADRLYANERELFPPANSRNETNTGHDGVFAVRLSDVPRYCETYAPQPLRYDRKSKQAPTDSINFGEAKGQTFNRTLVYPHGPLQKYLCDGNLEHIRGSLAKVYVAATRSRHSAAYVIPDKLQECILPIMYEDEKH